MKKAILTIDDVPSNNTKAIVDYLNEKDITVVMFAVGELLEKKAGECHLCASARHDPGKSQLYASTVFFFEFGGEQAGD